jgi:putative oxidoreductase
LVSVEDAAAQSYSEYFPGIALTLFMSLHGETMSGLERLTAYQPYALAALRIFAALLFIEHGTTKLFAFPVPMGEGGSLPPLMLAAACLELVGGLLLLVGFLTRPVAFLLSGEMAIAYFMAHMPRGFYPAVNGGGEAILFCFVFLFLVFAGAGALSVDSRKTV